MPLGFYAAPREFINYIAPDGTVFPFNVPSPIGRWVMNATGWGAPPIEYITQRGPAQQGDTVLDYFLRPRTIQLLIREQFCNREAYWSGRAALLNAIRPNRQATPNGVAPGSLAYYLPDGSQRWVDVHLAEGPRFGDRSQQGWDEWAFQEVLRFIAYNPVEYDPTLKTATFNISDDLTFPITFPIIFGALDATVNLAYLGTWLEYPTITITGPAESPSIENITTGEIITLDYDVAAGEVVTITLLYGTKTVTNGAGTNLIGTVTPESDLGTFHLAPDPEAPGGVNQIRVTGQTVNASTSVVISYRDRYFGF